MKLYLGVVLLSSTSLINAQQPCNGFTFLCSSKLNKILFPGTHNSYSLATETPPSLASNQNWSIKKQLDEGIRFIDLDLWRLSSTNKQLQLCHGGCNLLDAGSLQAAVDILSTFIINHPREFLFISLENKAEATPQELAIIFAPIIQYALIPEIQGQVEWPTLGTLLDTNIRTMILMDLNTSFEPTYAWLLNENQYIGQNGYQTFSPDTFDCPETILPFTLLNHQLSVSVFGSTEIYYPNYSQVQTTNARQSLMDHLVKCGINGGIMMVDFGLTGDLLETVGSVNNVSVSKPGKNQVEPPQGSFGFKGQSCGLMLCGLITLSLLFTQ